MKKRKDRETLISGDNKKPKKIDLEEKIEDLLGNLGEFKTDFIANKTLSYLSIFKNSLKEIQFQPIIDTKMDFLNKLPNK